MGWWEEGTGDDVRDSWGRSGALGDSGTRTGMMAAKRRPAPLWPWRDGWHLRTVVGAPQVLPLCMIPQPCGPSSARPRWLLLGDTWRVTPQPRSLCGAGVSSHVPPRPRSVLLWGWPSAQQCDLWARCPFVPQFPPCPGHGRTVTRRHAACGDVHNPSPQPQPVLLSVLPGRAGTMRARSR